MKTVSPSSGGGRDRRPEVGAGALLAEREGAQHLPLRHAGEEVGHSRWWRLREGDRGGGVHLTKRSEDVRARLAVLSELPGEWSARLSVVACGHRRLPARPARREHRVPAVADPRRRLAAGRGPPGGLPGEGHPRGQAAHDVDGAGRGLRRRRPLVRRAGARRPGGHDRGGRLRRPPRAALPRERPEPEAPGADAAGRPGRLPGVRPGRPLAGQPDKGFRRSVDYGRRRNRLAALDAGEDPRVDQVLAAEERRRSSIAAFEQLRSEQKASAGRSRAPGEEKQALLARAKELAARSRPRRPPRTTAPRRTTG